jgi:hypothetical protein
LARCFLASEVLRKIALRAPSPAWRRVWVCDHARGLPVLHRSSSCMHAVAITPVKSQSASFALFLCNISLPRSHGGSASTSRLSRPLQRSLTLRPAYSPSHFQDPLHRRLQPFRYLHDCSDCHRLERKLPGGICTRWKTVPLHGAHDKGRYHSLTSSVSLRVCDGDYCWQFIKEFKSGIAEDLTGIRMRNVS